jgi:hypothetical protein
MYMHSFQGGATLLSLGLIFIKGENRKAHMTQNEFNFLVY